ncbi:hypothetical protein ABD87_14855 [Lysinibacillus sphaericus]|uniref:DUF6744 family protein n=1 Tax=Lysinibacillus sphaericus TaxID=1421 RepID=UPI0018CCB2B3|nr:DUF6744 family protein [Lysinibacillus sphaericus]MBG9730775.1 hypothetical protein [Lysinibacillus sphaericus]
MSNIKKENLVVRVDGGQSIGLLLMYSIPDKDYNREELREAYENNHLDISHLPKNIRGYNAFKRATNSVNKKGFFDSFDSLGINTEGFSKMEFSVHDILAVAETKGYARRNLVIKLVKATGNEDSLSALDFDPKVCTFIHDNEKEIIGANIGEDYEDNEYINHVVEKVKEEYYNCLNNFSGTQVRESLRKHIAYMRALAMLKNGSGYFITNEYREQAMNFVKMVQDIGGQAVYFNMMDGDSDRDQLKNRYTEFVQSMLSTVSNHDYKNKENFTKRDVETLLRKVKEANEDYSKFVELLRIDETTIKQQQDSLKVATKELLHHIESLEMEIQENRRKGRAKK